MRQTKGVVALDELDLFTEPKIQDSIIADIVSEYRPLNEVTSLAHPMRFEVRTAEDEYIKMNESELYMKLEIGMVYTNEANVEQTVTATQWGQLSVVNNFLHSLFDSVVMNINGEVITRHEQNYAYKAYLETLLGFNNVAKENYLSSVLWSNEDSSTDTLSRKRTSMIAPTVGSATKTLELQGKLFTDLTYQPRSLPGGIRLDLELNFNKPSFFFHTTNVHIKPYIKIIDTLLFVHKSKVTPGTLVSHHRYLNGDVYKYPITHTHVTISTITKGVQEAYMDNAANGQLPRRIIVGLVTGKATNGDLGMNPFFFDTHNLNYICAFYNGMSFPHRPYTPDYANGLYLREYTGLVNAYNQDVPNSIFPFSRSQFVRGFTLYAFNFAPDLSDGACGAGYVNEKKQGVLRLQLKFKEQLKDQVNVVIYYEYDNNIVIDKDKHPHTDFHTWTPIK